MAALLVNSSAPQTSTCTAPAGLGETNLPGTDNPLALVMAMSLAPQTSTCNAQAGPGEIKLEGAITN